MIKQRVDRREFLRQTGAGATGTAVALGAVSHPEARLVAASGVDSATLVAAIGDTLIPSDPGDPGYRTLEPYNITAEVLKGLRVRDEELSLFNGQAARLFPGKTFVELSESERRQYFDQVFAGQAGDEDSSNGLRDLLHRIRRRVFRVYYGNYPEHALPRDSDGVPMLEAGNIHQITNPNTEGMVTGWDVSGFTGPLTWEEEERRRSILKQIDWKE